MHQQHESCKGFIPLLSSPFFLFVVAVVPQYLGEEALLSTSSKIVRNNNYRFSTRKILALEIVPSINILWQWRIK